MVDFCWGERMNSISKALSLIITDIKMNYKGLLIYIVVAFLMDRFFGTICPMRLFVGLPCPACGMTRATILIFLGEFRAAYEMYPLIYFVYFFLFLLCFFRYFARKWFDKFLYCGIIILSIILVVYVYRMGTLFPKVEPMTYDQNNLLNFILRGLLYGK